MLVWSYSRRRVTRSRFERPSWRSPSSSSPSWWTRCSRWRGSSPSRSGTSSGSGSQQVSVQQGLICLPLLEFRTLFGASLCPSSSMKEQQQPQASSGSLWSCCEETPWSLMFDSVQFRSSTGVSAGGWWVEVYTAGPEQTSEDPQTNLLLHVTADLLCTFICIAPPWQEQGLFSLVYTCIFSNLYQVNVQIKRMWPKYSGFTLWWPG